MTFTFTYHGDPISASRPRVTSSGWAYTGERYAQYKRDFAAVLANHYRIMTNFQAEPMTGPLRLNAAFFRKTKVRCDADNLLKALMDVLMAAGVIQDDSQIVEVKVSKGQSPDNPRVEFSLEGIQP